MNIKYATSKIVTKTILFVFSVGFLFVISKNIFEKNHPMIQNFDRILKINIYLRILTNSRARMILSTPHLCLGIILQSCPSTFGA